MAIIVLKNCLLLTGGLDFSKKSNDIKIDLDTVALPATGFRMDTKVTAPGLKTFKMDGTGFWSGGTNDISDTFFDNLSLSDQIISVSGEGNIGDVAMTLRANEASFQSQGNVGDLLKVTMSQINGSLGDVIAGTVVDYSTYTASGNSAGQNLGAVSANQKLYCVLHVLEASGTTPTLNGIIQSDTDVGFASPITRATFSQATTYGAQWIEVDGAITDTWYRASFTIGGTTPSFKVAIVLGVQ